MTKRLPGFFLEILKKMEQEQAENSDAAVWVQGDRFERGKKILELFNAGYAPKILLTGNNVLVGEKTAKGTNNITIVETRRWLRQRGVSSSKIIIDKNSYNTYEQAINVLSLARRLGWKKILLVASFYHQPRAYLTFLKASKKVDWAGKIINQPTRIDWKHKPKGRDKTARELALEEIEKIDLYNLHKI